MNDNGFSNYRQMAVQDARSLAAPSGNWNKLMSAC
jgi:hypothetical protein